MINLLLLTCGSNACYHFSKRIKESFKSDFRLIGTDINDSYLIPSINYIDVFYKSPYSNSPDYYQFILDICKKEKVNFILPLFDIDQRLFNTSNKDLKNLGIHSFGLAPEVSDIYTDKLQMYKYLQSCNMPLPQIFNKLELDDDKYYFIKPYNGSGSIGTEKLCGADIKTISDNNIMIQELCSEPEYTVECFHYQNTLRTVMRERIVSKAGVCTKTKICYIPELYEIVEKFVKNLHSPICFNLQFMKNSLGNYVITDVNLRLAGGMSLAYAAGWDEVTALAKIMLGKEKREVFSTLPEHIPEQYIVRAYTDIVTKIVRPIVAFDLDGTLLDSRKRHSVVLDFVLDKYNLKIDTSNLIDFKRQGKNNIDYLISKGISESLAKDIQTEWINNIENIEFLKSDELYPNAISILKQYSENNDLILITARNNDINLQKQICDLGIDTYFKNIYVVKPGQEAAKNKAEILKKKHAKLMIGDSEIDKQAADFASIDFMWVNHGFRERVK